MRGVRLVSLGHLVTWCHLVRKAKVPFGSPDHFLGWLEENARKKSNKTSIFLFIFLSIFVKNYDDGAGSGFVSNLISGKDKCKCGPACDDMMLIRYHHDYHEMATL